MQKNAQNGVLNVTLLLPFDRLCFLHLFFSRFFFILGCLWGPLWLTWADFWPPKSDSGANLAPTLHPKSDWEGQLGPDLAQRIR